MTKRVFPIILLALAVTCWAETKEKVIFSFNLKNGNLPNAGLIADSQGNLYGTTSYNGGKYGYGNVFKLSRTGNTWKETVLYDFKGKTDGAWPLDSLIFDKSGNLYGTAESGGQGRCVKDGNNVLGCGVVFELSPANGKWTETVLFSFVPGKVKGVIPVSGLVFDNQGNLYGTTWAPGITGNFNLQRVNPASANTFWGCDKPGCGGTVFQLAPTKSGWKESDIYAFTGAKDGSTPQGTLLIDAKGILFGTTVYGGTTGCTSGYGCGVVFQLSPKGNGWKQTVLYRFTGGNDGAYPMGSLIADKSGVFYSTAAAGGSANQGTVFSLEPNGQKWKESVLYSFNGPDGSMPMAGLLEDSKGILYGTTNQGGNNWGLVFKLESSNGTWKETILHNFTLTGGDAENPAAPLIFGPKGLLYGTSQSGGSSGIHGAVFQVAP
jgi:uncharacterized repeat protein (TIGR03803 family)